MNRRSRIAFSLLCASASLATAAAGAAAVETPIEISGRFTVATARGLAACDRVDVVATLRQVGGAAAERRAVARATSLRDDGRRWSYRLDLEPFPAAAGAQEIELSARCDGGADPLLRHELRVPPGAAWTNPFPAPAAGASIKRNFRIKVSGASEPPAELAMSPVATNAYGGIAGSGGAPCDATPPELSLDDPNATLTGWSNDAGSGCRLQTTLDGTATFDLSRLQEWSDRIAGAELRYTESDVARRGTADTCVEFVAIDEPAPAAWPRGRAISDRQTRWEVSDIVEWWLDSEDPAPTLALLAPADPPADDSACLSRVGAIELVVHFAE